MLSKSALTEHIPRNKRFVIGPPPRNRFPGTLDPSYPTAIAILHARQSVRTLYNSELWSCTAADIMYGRKAGWAHLLVLGGEFLFR